jgi:hypothetical protein
MKDEKLYTQFWVSRSGFLVTLIFDFLTLGGSLILTRCAINLKYVREIQKLNNLSETSSFVEIFQREPKKFCLVTPKIVKNWHFLVIFSTKTRHTPLDFCSWRFKEQPNHGNVLWLIRKKIIFCSSGTQEHVLEDPKNVI